MCTFDYEFYHEEKGTRKQAPSKQRRESSSSAEDRSSSQPAFTFCDELNDTGLNKKYSILKKTPHNLRKFNHKNNAIYSLNTKGFFGKAVGEMKKRNKKFNKSLRTTGQMTNNTELIKSKHKNKKNMIVIIVISLRNMYFFGGRLDL